MFTPGLHRSRITASSPVQQPDVQVMIEFASKRCLPFSTHMLLVQDLEPLSNRVDEHTCSGIPVLEHYISTVFHLNQGQGHALGNVSADLRRPLDLTGLFTGSQDLISDGLCSETDAELGLSSTTRSEEAQLP
jgi:hypothetical protein